MIEIHFLAASFVAGLLTILAPCILPVLPIILGRSVDKNKARPLVIVGALSVSIIIFTLFIRFITESLNVPLRHIQFTAGAILLMFGVLTLFPDIWDRIGASLQLSQKSNHFMGAQLQRSGLWADVLLGASLGPVFTSCSPTYAVIVSLVLTGSSTAAAALYLILYVIGLGGLLLLIAYAGQRFVAKLNVLADPKGIVKRLIGILFIIIGLSIMTGYDKKAEKWLLDKGLYDPIAEFENGLIE